MDDEKNIRDRLTNSFTWNEWGFKIAGSAENGLDAWNIIRKEVPHVVLTDILMPEMNGIELAGKIKSSYPQIKVVILSAYDDFKYARDAIKYGVRGYLLKPLIKEELEELFYGLYHELSENENERNKNATRESLLIDILKGCHSRICNKDIINKLNLSCLNNYTRIALCSFEQVLKIDSRFTLQQLILKKSAGYWENFNVPVVYYGHEIILFINDIKPISKAEIQKQLENFKENIKSELEKYIQSSIEITISVGNMYKGINNISQSYNEANYACSYRYFKGIDSVIFYQDISFTKKIKNSFDSEEIKIISDSIIEAVLSGNLNDIRINIYAFFSFLEESGKYRVSDIQLKCAEILIIINLKAKDKKIKINNFDKTEILEILQTISTLNELRCWLSNKLISIAQDIKEIERDDVNRYIISVKKYLEKNYSNRITLEEVAETLHLNPAYLSYIFKKVTGQNFINYLNEIRVRKAAELIKNTDYTIKEISYMVGYNNVSYFNRIFKKIMGEKPLIYRAGKVQTG